MNELLPIIRRKRRPLIVADAPPVVVVTVEPANPSAGVVDKPKLQANDSDTEN